MRLTPDERHAADAEIDRQLIQNAASMCLVGIPEYWITLPDTRQFPAVEPGRRYNELFGVQRNHKRGHGWKANHES
jgi:hypothetical protein